MHKLLKEKYPNIDCSLSSYRKIFVTNFNVWRKWWQKDTCNKCDIFVVQQRNAAGNEERVNALLADHNIHLAQGDSTWKLMKDNFVSVHDDPDLQVISFDLEKTLPILQIPSNLVYYKRQLCFYKEYVPSYTTITKRKQLRNQKLKALC